MHPIFMHPITLPAGLENIEIDMEKTFQHKSQLEKKILAATGIIATLIGIISIIPIAMKAWKTKKASSFTTTALVLAIISNALWVIFGISSGVKASLLSGSLYLAFYIFIFIIHISY